MTENAARKQFEQQIGKVAASLKALGQAFEKLAADLTSEDMQKGFHYLHGAFIAAKERAELDHRISQGVSQTFSLDDVKLPETVRIEWLSNTPVIPPVVPAPVFKEPETMTAIPLVTPAPSPIGEDGAIDLRGVDGKAAAKMIGGRLTKEGRKERNNRPRRYASVKTDLHEDDDDETPPSSTLDDVDFVDE